LGPKHLDLDLFPPPYFVENEYTLGQFEASTTTEITRIVLFADEGDYSGSKLSILRPSLLEKKRLGQTVLKGSWRWTLTGRTLLQHSN